MERKNKIYLIILLVIMILGTVSMLSRKNKGREDESVNYSNSVQTEEKHGVIGIEVKKPEKEKYGSIKDFDYELSDKKIMLKEYTGKTEILEIKSSYKVDGKKYKTDLSDFQVGIGNRCVKTLILCKGIKKVNNAIFNSSDVEKVYFPKSMKVVYDNTLAYMDAEDGKTIKIYYGGTKKEWGKIFKEYKRKKVEDTKFGGEMGEALADKVNEMAGMEYDSSEFEYFFSASPDDLK